MFLNNNSLLDIHVTMFHDKFLIIKPTRCTNFSNLIWNETLHISDSSCVHHQEFFSVHTVTAYEQDQDGTGSILILLVSCQQTHMTYTIAVCTVKNSWWWTGEMSKTFRVSVQNKFEKLVHLVGFIIRNNSLILKLLLYECWESFNERHYKSVLVFNLLSAILWLLVANTSKLMVRLLAVAWPA
jgi:hypothetical protein